MLSQLFTYVAVPVSAETKPKRKLIQVGSSSSMVDTEPLVDDVETERRRLVAHRLCSRNNKRPRRECLLDIVTVTVRCKSCHALCCVQYTTSRSHVLQAVHCSCRYNPFQPTTGTDSSFFCMKHLTLLVIRHWASRSSFVKAL